MSYNTVEVSEYLSQLFEYYKFTVGATTYRYNNSSRDVTLSIGTPAIDGTYTAIPISMSEYEHARDAASLRTQITVPRDNTVAAFFRSSPPDGEVPVVVYRKHESDSEVIAWFQGSVRSCDFRGKEAVMLVEPLLAKMQRLGLYQRYQLTCNLQLYGSRCGVDPTDFDASVTVTDIDGLEVTVSGMPAVADDYYTGGYMQMADGSKRFITDHAGAVLTLMLDFDDLAVTDTVTIFAGCDRQQSTCRSKFFPSGGSLVAGVGNIRNFYGFFTNPNRNPFTQGLTQGGAQQGAPEI
jgi:uncharacterized phage protein (TIGR02218 family)